MGWIIIHDRQAVFERAGVSTASDGDMNNTDSDTDTGSDSGTDKHTDIYTDTETGTDVCFT